MGRLVCVLAVLTPALAAPPIREGAMAFSLTSSAFRNGEPIPTQHTCDGPDVSPPLAWRGAPDGTAAFALIVDDPDAPGGIWVHWVLYDVPTTLEALAEHVDDGPTPHGLGGAAQGRNDFRRLGYGGPCPPPGPSHRYLFKLYALRRTLGIAPGATKAELERGMAGQILAMAELMGRYQRRSRG
jgi:Raf kinase inhibitor-like YbhB/YbcL family protein